MTRGEDGSNKLRKKAMTRCEKGDFGGGKKPTGRGGDRFGKGGEVLEK